MKKRIKNIAFCTLIGAIAISGMIGLSGCKKDHIHTFNSDPYYEVVVENDTQIARTWTVCACGEESEHHIVDNAIIASANPEDDNYAQKVLDSDINGKTVVFAAGEYTELLEIRPSRTNYTKAYIYGSGQIEEVDPLYPIHNPETHTYGYERDLTDVKFVGTKNTVFKNKLYIRSGPNGNEDRFFTTKYDAVLNRVCDSKVAYHAIINIDNISFERLNFESQKAQIYMFLINTNSTYDGITIKNCKWNQPENYVSDGIDDGAAIYITPGNPLHIKNFDIKNNYIDGYYQGIYVASCNNINIENNVIKNTDHNAIALQTAYSAQNNTDYSITGNVVIKNNTIQNTGDRAVRFGVVIDADITVENNTFIDAKDSDNELLKTQVLINSSYNFTNNLIDGKLTSTTPGENKDEITTPWKITIN